jgi:hypothetical protein
MADRSNQRLQTLGIPQAPEADSVMRSRRADSPLGPGLMPNNRPDTCVQSTQSKIYGILQNRGRSYMEYAGYQHFVDWLNQHGALAACRS